MEQQFKASLTGAEGPVTGIIKTTNFNGYEKAYRFDSMNKTLHLTIAPDHAGKWHKLDATEPFLLDWIDEMAAQIPKLPA
ncbi:hypothetical protein ACFS5N_01935 [Mucilaginibacter ximonensis]|uniref:Uncharacterized protein n=1 Tax=Mucilaginibacter ximonensis TaxID=538021 RepID=A0ABW5Y7A7_9SPHI